MQVTSSPPPNPWISVQGAAVPMLIAISHRIPHYPSLHLGPNAHNALFNWTVLVSFLPSRSFGLFSAFQASIFSSRAIASTLTSVVHSFTNHNISAKKPRASVRSFHHHQPENSTQTQTIQDAFHDLCCRPHRPRDGCHPRRGPSVHRLQHRARHRHLLRCHRHRLPSSLYDVSCFEKPWCVPHELN